MSSTGYFQPRSPLSGESSRPGSPSGSGAASPPGSYLRIHPSRAPHSPLAISTNLGVPHQGAGVRSPTSPGRAQTHRTLGHIPLGAAAAHAASAPPYPPYQPAQGRQGMSMAPPHANNSAVTTPLAGPAGTSSSYSHSHSLTSPCYVHSHLDHTLNDVVKRDGSGGASGSPGAADGTPRAARKKLRSRPSDYGQDSAAQAHSVGEQPQHEQHEGAADPQLVLPGSGVDSGDSGDETSDDEKNTWTRQLAETAVSVREMSRQLGTSLPLLPLRLGGDLTARRSARTAADFAHSSLQVAPGSCRTSSRS